MGTSEAPTSGTSLTPECLDAALIEKKARTAFEEAKAQDFRLELIDGHLRSRSCNGLFSQAVAKILPGKALYELFMKRAEDGPLAEFFAQLPSERIAFVLLYGVEARATSHFSDNYFDALAKFPDKTKEVVRNILRVPNEAKPASHAISQWDVADQILFLFHQHNRDKGMSLRKMLKELSGEFPDYATNRMSFALPPRESFRSYDRDGDGRVDVIGELVSQLNKAAHMGEEKRRQEYESALLFFKEVVMEELRLSGQVNGLCVNLLLAESPPEFSELLNSFNP